VRVLSLIGLLEGEGDLVDGLVELAPAPSCHGPAGSLARPRLCS
jgi:hypothetical protein